MNFIVFAWLTSISYGLGGVIGKIAANHHIKNPWLYNVLWFVITIIGILPFALSAHVGMPSDWSSMIWLAVANAISGTLFILAFYAIDLSILSPLSNLRTPIVALIGVLFLRETLTIWQWVLIGLIFSAGAFVNMDERMSMKSIASKKILLGCAWILASVWFNSMIKVASLYNGYWEVTLWSNILALPIVLITVPLFYADLVRTPLKKYWGMAASSILYTLGMVLSIKALSENVGITMAIISLPLSMLMTMMLSRINPNLLEKHTAKVYTIRVVAAAVMVGAALGLSR